MTLVLASGNAHKAAELRRLWAPIEVLLPSDLGLAFDCEETGATYFENAYLKAATLRTALAAAGRGRFVIADDSGLEVAALGGRPGVRSARFGSDRFGRRPTASEQHGYLLELLGDAKDRSAAFVCCMVLLASPSRWSSVQEIVAGHIGRAPRGDRGFGYDPLFFLPDLGVTMAELDDESKDRISHRGRAVLKLRAIAETEWRSE